MDCELTPEERAFRLGFALGEGQRLRITDVMQLTGLTDNGSISLLLRMSRVGPIVGYLGLWQRCAENMKDGRGRLVE